MAITPKSSWPWVKTLLHSVFDQPDAQSVGAQYVRVIDALADKLPKVADHLEQARADLLAFTAFPATGPRAPQEIPAHHRYPDRTGDDPGSTNRLNHQVE